MSSWQDRQAGRTRLHGRVRLWIVLCVAPTLTLWRARRHQRAALAELEPHQLRDLGLRREQALREADKPFWR